MKFRKIEEIFSEIYNFWFKMAQKLVFISKNFAFLVVLIFEL